MLDLILIIVPESVEPQTVLLRSYLFFQSVPQEYKLRFVDNTLKHRIMGTIQNNIKAIRKKLGYTQETVADVLGIARPTYTEYETKDIDIPFNTLERFLWS